MSDQKLCPTCGTEYPLSERFCPRDGTALRSSNPQGDLVGTVVGNNFHVIRKLGEGGMGTVYLAEHVKMGRKAALKVMNPGMSQDADAIARFNREATNASKLSHPNICGIYDFGETADGLIFLAMEFVEGESLSSLIATHGALSARRAAAIIHQCADALQVAHDYGIVHRDLKPDNIMIARARDGSDMVKVVDFGIAKASSSDAQKVTKTGLVVGTPEYMSPEQLSGDRLDGRSDIYSLALVAFNCLTVTLPFPGASAQEAMIMRLTDQPKTLAEMKPDVPWPAEVQAVMDKALAREASERYQSASEFGRDFARAVEQMPAAGATAGAADAKTVVIGAGAVASAAANAGARTGAAPVVPRTSVAGPSDLAAAASAAGSSPGGSARKRGLPMPVLAAAAVIVLGGGGWAAVQMMGGRGAATAADSSAGTTGNEPVPPQRGNPPDADPGVAGAPAPAAGGGGGGGGGTTKPSTPLNPAADPARSGTVQAANQTAPTVDVAAELNNIDDLVSKLGDKAAAQAALAQIADLMPKIRSHDDSVMAIFHKATAYTTIDDDVARACRALKEIRGEPRTKRGVDNAWTALECK